MYTVLLIDDDTKLADLLSQYFAPFELHLTAEAHPEKGLQTLYKKPFDAIILDVMLPDMDGFEVCKEIRKTHDTPIIMLTARGETTDKIVGLEIGADDYLGKPFEPRELVARIKNLIKRAQAKPMPTLVSQHIQLDAANQQLQIRERTIALTTKEYALLEFFISHHGTIVSRDDIQNALQGIDSDFFSRSIDIAVSRLRKKLEPDAPIQTIRGRGYRYNGLQS